MRALTTEDVPNTTIERARDAVDAVRQTPRRQSAARSRGSFAADWRPA